MLMNRGCVMLSLLQFVQFTVMGTDMKRATVNLTSLQNILWSSFSPANQHGNVNPPIFNRKHTYR